MERINKMSFTRKFELVCKVGTYNKDGQTKNRYANVGALMSDDSGKQFLLIDPCFNFAGINRGDKDRVIVNLFEPKSKEDKPKAQEEVDWSTA